MARIEVAGRPHDSVLVELDHLLDGRVESFENLHYPGGPGFVGQFRVGIEPQREQLDQRPGDVGVVDQRVGHIAGAEAGPDLAEVGGVGPHDPDLGPGQSGDQHQPVETVGLDFAGPRLDEGGLEAGLHLCHVVTMVRRDLEAEVVEMERSAVARLDRVRLFVKDVGPEILEDREHIGQTDLVVDPVDLQLKPTGG